MRARILGHLEELMQVIEKNPELQRIIDGPHSRAEINPSLYRYIKGPASVIGKDMLELKRRTDKIVEGEKYDITKTRRRVEEHLRKYAAHQTIIGLALYLGIPVA